MLVRLKRKSKCVSHPTPRGTNISPKQAFFHAIYYIYNGNELRKTHLVFLCR